MDEHEKQLLEMARRTKETWPPEHFRSWLRGFRLVGTESEELKNEFDKLKEEADADVQSGEQAS